MTRLDTLQASIESVMGGKLNKLVRDRGEITVTVALIGAYVAIALGYSTIYQATVKLGVWRYVIESLEVSNVAVLEEVAAAGARPAASPGTSRYPDSPARVPERRPTSSSSTPAPSPRAPTATPSGRSAASGARTPRRSSP